MGAKDIFVAIRPLAVVLLAFGSVSSFASIPGRRVPFPTQDIVKDCLEVQIPEHAWDFFKENLKWTLKCPVGEFRSRIEKNHKSWPPHVRLLVSDVLFHEFLKFRSEQYSLHESKVRYEREEGFKWDPSVQASQQKVPVKPFSAQALVDVTVSWADQFELLLKPLYTTKLSSKRYGRRQPQIFRKESGVRWVRFLSASRRHKQLATSIKNDLEFLFFNSKDRTAVLAILQDAVDNEPETLALFKDTLLKHYSKIPDKKDRRVRSEDLQPWLSYLSLQPKPRNKKEREALLKTLRRMWILFPKKSDKVAIRKKAIELGVSSAFAGPSPRQMKIEEIVMHSRKQNAALLGAEGLKTMDQVLKLPTKTVDPDELWDALEWHIRLLRIMDQRHKIAGLLNQYLKKGRFIDTPKKASDREKFFDRFYQVARWRWSYDKISVAVQNFDQIIALNRAWNTDHQLAKSYYIRARIAEQNGDKLSARPYFDQAIQELALRKKDNDDLHQDLLWRRFFNSLDLGALRGNYQLLVQEMEAIRPEIDFKEDGIRWYFWMGQAHLLEGNKDKAAEYFEKAYEEEPLSYYSSLSGVELIRMGREAPSGWNLPSAEKYWKADETAWSEPSFSEVFNTKTLSVRKSQNWAWPRIYGLASIGQFEELKRYLSSLERRAYVYALSSTRRYRKSTKRRLIRKIGWLRLAAGDNIGSLRMGELARITFEGDIGAEELAFLYPLPFKNVVMEKAAERKIDPWHSISLIRQESAFNPVARSSANALGLMQVIPPVARQEAEELKIKDFDPANLSDPRLAVRIGTFHLAKLLEHFGDSLIVSTAGYNAGRPPAENWLENYLHPVPYAFVDRISFAETRGYVRSIMRNYVNYSRIYNDAKIDKDKLLKMPGPMSKLQAR